MRLGSMISLFHKGIYGSSSNDGFTIMRDHDNKCVKSKNFVTRKKVSKIFHFLKKYWFIILSVWLFYAFIWFFPLVVSQNTQSLWSSSGNFIGFLIQLLFCLLAAETLTHIIFSSNLYGKNISEYHACEHKVICLLGEKLEPTLENLKNMPRLTIYCGSILVGIFALLPLIWGLANIGWFFSVINPFADMIIRGSGIIIFLVGPSLLQFFFVTREPSEEKLKEAIEVVREFLEV